jgi:hypothetical protein
MYHEFNLRKDQCWWCLFCIRCVREQRLWSGMSLFLSLQFSVESFDRMGICVDLHVILGSNLQLRSILPNISPLLASVQEWDGEFRVVRLRHLTQNYQKCHHRMQPQPQTSIKNHHEAAPSRLSKPWHHSPRTLGMSPTLGFHCARVEGWPHN